MKEKIDTKVKKIEWSNMGIIIALIVMVLFFSFSTATFLTPNNLANISRQISIVGICAL